MLVFKRLSFTHFRSYISTTFEPASGVNVLIGENGAGKTNVLEALHFLALTKGFHPDAEATHTGEQFFMLEGQGMRQQTPFCIQCNYLKGKGKKLLFNQTPLQKLAEHIGRIPIVCVRPEDQALVQEGGMTRRRWLDSFLAQADAEYLSALMQYEKALEQRNALLTQGLTLGHVDEEGLLPWTTHLAYQGAVIACKRQQFMTAFAPFFEDFHKVIIGSADEPPVLMLDSTLPDVPSPQLVFDALNASFKRDCATGRTNVGTHRDDLKFMVQGKPLRGAGSQGQQKTFILALKLAQHAYLYQKTGVWPLLLLDDLFDKLDKNRIRHLAAVLATLKNTQIFITDTDQTRLANAFDGQLEVTYFGVHQRQVYPL